MDLLLSLFLILRNSAIETKMKTAFVLSFFISFIQGAVLPPDPKIVGGVDVDIVQFPHQVSLLINFGLHCGGSIIGETFALTAAHCVYGEKTSEIKIRSGSSYTEDGGLLHEVTSYVIHPLYNKNSHDYDVAIVKVTPIFNYDDTNQPILLADEEPEADASATVSGWGATSDGGGAVAHLKAVTVPIIDRDICYSKYAPHENVITPRMICAGATGKDSCQGDSGGAIIVGDLQVGIVSWGIGCADLPGVYSNVADPEIRAWINSIVTNGN